MKAQYILLLGIQGCHANYLSAKVPLDGLNEKAVTIYPIKTLSTARLVRVSAIRELVHVSCDSEEQHWDESLHVVHVMLISGNSRKTRSDNLRQHVLDMVTAHLLPQAVV